MKKRLLRKRPFVVLRNRKRRREDGVLDLALSDIIENAGSTNSVRVVMPAVVAELVIPAVCDLAPCGYWQWRGTI